MADLVLDQQQARNPITKYKLIEFTLDALAGQAYCRYQRLDSDGSVVDTIAIHCAMVPAETVASLLTTMIQCCLDDGAVPAGTIA